MSSDIYWDWLILVQLCKRIIKMQHTEIIAATVNPNAICTIRIPAKFCPSPTNARVPQPKKTSANVPINSAAHRFNIKLLILNPPGPGDCWCLPRTFKDRFQGQPQIVWKPRNLSQKIVTLLKLARLLATYQIPGGFFNSDSWRTKSIHTTGTHRSRVPVVCMLFLEASMRSASSEYSACVP